MTDTDNTTYPEVTWELNDIISNLEVLISLNYMDLSEDNDKAKLSEMTGIYGEVLIKDFKNVAQKMMVIERFYNDFHKDLEGNITA